MALEAIADLIREYQYDYFVDDYVDVSYPCEKGGFEMNLVDTVTCVVCGKKEYAISKGKSARAQNGVCAEHQAQLGGASNAQKENGPPRK